MRSALAASVIATLALTGCAGTDEDPAASTSPAETRSPTANESATPHESPSPSESVSPTEEAEEDAIEVRIEGDSIEPNGERVEVTAGQPIVLAIESDRAAELHVHSSPEQTVPVKRGRSTVELVIDRPGVVEVEEHESGIVVLQLEVR